MLRFVIALLLTLSCGTPPNKVKHTPIEGSQRAALTDKYKLYSTLTASQQDAQGFTHTEACDSLLFTGLLGSGIGPTNTIDLPAARDNLGAWHRRPLAYPECYPDGAASTTSRDMLLGVMWYSYSNKRLDIAQDLWSYGMTHNWVMGQGDVSRIYFTPGLQATLAELIYRLGGENHAVARNIPQIYSQNTGYQAHLDLLHIGLRGELTSKLDDDALSIVAYNYNRVPQNPLFSYVYHKYTDGNQTNTIASLMDASLFPNNRLPTNLDRAAPWVSERDPTDWRPAPAGTPLREHSGGDLIFVAGLLLR